MWKVSQTSKFLLGRRSRVFGSGRAGLHIQEWLLSWAPYWEGFSFPFWQTLTSFAFLLHSLVLEGNILLTATVFFMLNYSTCVQIWPCEVLSPLCALQKWVGMVCKRIIRSSRFMLIANKTRKMYRPVGKLAKQISMLIRKAELDYMMAVIQLFSSARTIRNWIHYLTTTW